jgi:hypothetical protein
MVLFKHPRDGWAMLLRTRRGWLQRTPQTGLPHSVSPKVAPSRADCQRPFERLPCRLAGADFLEVLGARRFLGAATASAGACSGNAATGEIISPAAVAGQLGNLMKRNAAAFCASNPRRAAVKVRASQGSIGYSPMTQAMRREANRIKRSGPAAAKHPSQMHCSARNDQRRFAK